MAKHGANVGITAKRQIASVLRKNPGMKELRDELKALAQSVDGMSKVLKEDVARLQRAFLKLYDGAEARSKKR